MLTWPWDHNKGPAIIVAYPPENYSDKSWVTRCKAENTAEQQQQDKSTWITNTTSGQNNIIYKCGCKVDICLRDFECELYLKLRRVCLKNFRAMPGIL